MVLCLNKFIYFIIGQAHTKEMTRLYKTVSHYRYCFIAFYSILCIPTFGLGSFVIFHSTF